jgi:(4S)-4-hydroxy-5-phosphonooxypentane-2,3-dione isomerase
MAYCLTVTFTVKEGELDAVLAAMRPLVEASRREPGCLLYQAHRDPEDENRFLLYEQYEDEAAFQAHHESEHFNTYAVAEMFPRRENSERTAWVTIDP